MRIAHIVRSLDPMGGGPPLVVVRLAAELARQGHEVLVISHRTPNAQKRIDAMIGSLSSATHVRYEVIHEPGKFEQFIPVDARRQIGELIRGFDFVHLHGVWDFILNASAHAAAQQNIPYAIAPHGMLDPWSMAQKSWKKKLALVMGYRAMLNQAAFLHLLNRDEKTLIEPLGFSCPVEVIPNGISPEEFTDLPPAGTFRKAFPKIGSAPYILFLSRLHYKKGLDILIEAFSILIKKSNSFAECNQVHLVIGGPDDGAKADLEKAIDIAGLNDRVHLIGPLFGKDKLSAFVDAACFCLPSRQEGFSIAILEAMACGLPVVISDACHFPEVAELHTGKVVELKPAEFASALDGVLSDPNEMGLSGRRLVYDRFTWPKVVETLTDAYQRNAKRQS